MYKTEIRVNPDNPDAGMYTVAFYDEGAVILSCTKNVTHVNIPAAINGKSVIRIGSEAFMLHPHLLSVTLPDTVRTIGDAAFMGCFALMSVHAGKGLEAVEAGAFGDCVNLQEVDFPSRPRASLSAFAGCYQLEAAREPVLYP
ncbi:MAG: leucine-rich repeat domain-containing protein [Clostridia bacterium]|nr:leucine-rich repeat domain-containing protein [Clostridia bacterium]